MTAAIDTVECDSKQEIPAEVAMVMSALEVGSQAFVNRRAARRCRYRVAANLKVFQRSTR